jgi:hypothetical protein
MPVVRPELRQDDRLLGGNGRRDLHPFGSAFLIPFGFLHRK